MSESEEQRAERADALLALCRAIGAEVAETRMGAQLDATKDVPARWYVLGCQDLARSWKYRTLPTPGQIREAARKARRGYERAQTTEEAAAAERVNHEAAVRDRPSIQRRLVRVAQLVELWRAHVPTARPELLSWLASAQAWHENGEVWCDPRDTNVRQPQPETRKKLEELAQRLRDAGVRLAWPVSQAEQEVLEW